MSQKRTYKQYSQEFKEEVVALVTEQGYSVPKAAESVGVKSSLVYKWKDKIESEKQGESLSVDERSELIRLRKENKELKMEKEILKKAADGTFTIHITLIDFQAIGRVVKDFIQIRKAIWSFSFNFFFPYERRCNGCCERYSRCNEISV